MKKLKAYMGFAWDEPQNGACLVFAENRKQAKKLAYRTVDGWFECEWIGIRVRLLNSFGIEYFLRRYNPKKPMVIESPECCKGNCDQWGNVDYPEDDDSGYYCEDCWDEIQDEDIE